VDDASSTLVSIEVHDVNDNAPGFARSIHLVTWYVGMATDALAVVKATDGDSGTCGRVLYSIVAGNEQRLFDIDVYSGMSYRIIQYVQDGPKNWTNACTFSSYWPTLHYKGEIFTELCTQ